MQNLTYDYVIIGAGPVGLYAANKIRKTKKTYVVLEKEKKCGGQPTFLYPEKIVTNFPTAKKILGDKIAKKIIGSNKLNIVYKTTVESIKKNKNNQYKIICNKKTFTAANVIICFGLGKFQHISLDLFNKNPKVTYEVKKIKQFKNKNVIILGGGDSANDYAKQIKDVAASTTLIYHNEKLKNENKKIDGIKYFLG
jgi:thioredoxin reductase (NADPH)